MKALLLILLVTLTISSCRTGTDPKNPTCQFTSKTLTRDSSEYRKDDDLDSNRAYTFVTQNVSMDSLLTSLCSQGFAIEHAYYSTVYLCADARGPLPVVVLSKPDPRILTRGFTQGAIGRLACSGEMQMWTGK